MPLKFAVFLKSNVRFKQFIEKKKKKTAPTQVVRCTPWVGTLKITTETKYLIGKC